MIDPGPALPLASMLFYLQKALSRFLFFLFFFPTFPGPGLVVSLLRRLSYTPDCFITSLLAVLRRSGAS